MITLRLVVAASLAPFLRGARRHGPFVASFPPTATLKNAIEAVGIPHTEVAEVRVNGLPGDLGLPVANRSDVLVRGWPDVGRVQPAAHLAFVADAHLGGLARYLRMLGLDTLHDTGLADATIRALAAAQARIVLTRDRELLKCADVSIGCYVRALEPESQLQEVDRRFGLAARSTPFSRCLRCNGALARIEKSEVAATLPAGVAASQESFARCPGCGQIYWPGSHFRRMRVTLARLLG